MFSVLKYFYFGVIFLGLLLFLKIGQIWWVFLTESWNSVFVGALPKSYYMFRCSLLSHPKIRFRLGFRQPHFSFSTKTFQVACVTPISRKRWLGVLGIYRFPKYFIGDSFSVIIGKHWEHRTLLISNEPEANRCGANLCRQDTGQKYQTQLQGLLQCVTLYKNNSLEQVQTCTGNQGESCVTQYASSTMDTFVLSALLFLFI